MRQIAASRKSFSKAFPASAALITSNTRRRKRFFFVVALSRVSCSTHPKHSAVKAAQKTVRATLWMLVRQYLNC